MEVSKWTGIILAGGQSSRMGTNKALLELNGSSVLTHIAEAIRPAVSRIIVSAGPNEAIYSLMGDERFECIQDDYPGKGPLAGLHAALKASSTDWNLVSACDMPLLQTSFFDGLKKLTEQYPTSSAIVPCVEGRIHPLAGVYHRRILPELEQCLIHERLRVTRWLEQIGCRYVETAELEQAGVLRPELQLSNMNTPEEFEHVRLRLHGSSGSPSA